MDGLIYLRFAISFLPTFSPSPPFGIKVHKLELEQKRSWICGVGVHMHMREVPWRSIDGALIWLLLSEEGPRIRMGECTRWPCQGFHPSSCRCIHALFVTLVQPLSALSVPVRTCSHSCRLIIQLIAVTEFYTFSSYYVRIRDGYTFTSINANCHY